VVIQLNHENLKCLCVEFRLWGALFNKLTLLSALLLLALGGYLLFVSYQAPSFYIFGDVEAMALLLFLVSGILITIWIVLQLMSKKLVQI